MNQTHYATLAAARWLATHPQDLDLDPALMADAFAQLVEARGGKVNFQTLGAPRHRVGTPPLCPRLAKTDMPRLRLVAGNPVIDTMLAARPATLAAIARYRATNTGTSPTGGDAA
ncbi:hypothetical protein P775_09735 [Puniceibacterium antarcticum]|uniref:Uncharacterized protein n=1 Tax=Puniceibacterium antarcticum TaxID=1206336 RepID=A0A2G8RFT6_9RHOB|nr:hypothetical protein [Puniceibacterium antarcticum]PIL20410.1 hypothetical protein P775_09735 [Puniceibacterium antarcticum]